MSTCNVPRYNNSCTTGGAGYLCYTDDRGKLMRNNCLKQKDIECSELLDKCLKECTEGVQKKADREIDDIRRKARDDRQSANERSTKCFDKYLKSGQRDHDWAMAHQTYLAIPGLTKSDPRYAPLMAKASALMQDLKDKACPSETIYHDGYSPKNPCFEDIRERQYHTTQECLKGCWETASYICSMTSECYCSEWLCQSDSVEIPPPPTPNEDRFVDGRERLTSVNASLSAYDVPIELVYTRQFLFGNLIWMSDLTSSMETVVTREYNEDRRNYTITTQNIYNNYVSMHMGIAAGEIAGITRVWLQENLLYDVTGSAQTIKSAEQDQIEIVTRTGGESQTPLEEEVLAVGFGRVPAYRGLATVFAKNVNLNRLPKGFPEFRFEVVKSVSSPSTEEVSEPFSDIVDVHFEPAARRVVTTGAGGESAVHNYDDFSTKFSYVTPSVGSFHAITPLPAILSYDGSYHITDVETEEYLGSSPALPGEGTLYRHIFENSRGATALAVVEDSSISLWEVDDQLGNFERISDYAYATKTFPYFVYGKVTHKQSSTNILEYDGNVFCLSTSGTEVAIFTIPCNTTDSLTGLLSPFETIIDVSDIISGTVEVIGAVSSDRAYTIIMFITDGVEYGVFSWNPVEGVLWKARVPSLPRFGPRISTNLSDRFFSYMGDNSSLYTIDLDTGRFWLSPTSSSREIHGTIQNQYYDSVLNSVTFISTNGELVRAYLNRLQFSEESVEDVIQDVARRAGIPPYHLNTIDVRFSPVTGYRSGTAISGRDVIEGIFEVYPTTAYEDQKIVFIRKSVGDTVEVDTRMLEEPFSYENVEESFNLRQATVYYTSDNLDGLEGIQTFSLESDAFSDGNRNSRDLRTTVLETDYYMRRLAELIVFSAQEDDSKSTIRIPPRYLSITPTDIVNIYGGYRVRTQTTGADFVIEAELYQDSLSKYAALVDIDIPVNNSLTIVDTVPNNESLCYPFIITAKPLSTAYDQTCAVYVSPSWRYDESSERISRISDEDSLTLRESITFSEKLAYGRSLTYLPDVLNKHTRQEKQFIDVEFVYPWMADIALRKFDERIYVPNGSSVVYFNLGTNTLLIGQEFVQFERIERISNNVVRYSSLHRARGSTDHETDTHYVGEPVFFYDVDALYKNEVPYGGFVKYASMGHSRRTYEMYRPKDGVATLRPTMPLGMYAATRLDVPTWGGKHIVIQADFRYPNIDDFYDDFVAEDLRDDRLAILPRVYLIKGEWDPVMFELYREDVDDNSYVIIHGDNLREFTLSETEENYFGYPFYDYSQGSFDPEIDTLTVVIANPKDEDYTTGIETLSVTSWTPSKTYTRRRSRGIVNNKVNVSIP